MTTQDRKSIELEDVARPESERTLTPLHQESDIIQRQDDEEAMTDKGELTPEDPNAVSLVGIENPLNWPAGRKWKNIGSLSLMTLLT